MTPWTVAHQATLSVGFPRKEYWSGLPFPSPGGLPAPGIELASPALAGELFTTEPPRKPLCMYTVLLKNPTLFSSDLCLFYSHFDSIIQFSANWPKERFYDKVAGDWMLHSQVAHT